MGFNPIQSNNIQPAQQPQKESVSVQKFDSMMDSMQQATETLDAEVTMLNKEMVGQKKDSGAQAQQTAGNIKQAPSNEEMLQQAAVLAGEVMTEEEDPKVKKKKKKDRRNTEGKIDSMMQQLGGLEDQVDPNQLDPESKGVFEKFFGIMRQVKNLRRELKQLSMEEDEFERRMAEQDQSR